MIDNEIIEDLEYIRYHLTASKHKKVIDDAIDVINRLQAEKEALIAGQETMSKYIEEQQAEIERLSKKNEELAEILSDTIRIRYAEAKAEAVKRFAERLKKLSHNLYPFSDEPIIDCKDVDNLVKEMVGEAE